MGVHRFSTLLSSFLSPEFRHVSCMTVHYVRLVKPCCKSKQHQRMSCRVSHPAAGMYVLAFFEDNACNMAVFKGVRRCNFVKASARERKRREA